METDIARAAGDAIDLRSDTVTTPTPEMYEAIARARLGDDGLDGDPTARELEEVTARLLGKQAGVYFPSATMANLAAIMAQAGRQEIVLAQEDSHIYCAERGGAGLSGAFYVPLPGPDGTIDTGRLHEALTANRSKLRTAVVCLENSHNSAGGAVLPLAYMEQVFSMTRQAGASVHLDGARLFNAAAYLQVPAKAIADHCDTVAVCLSKGLSAPMGAVLVGDSATLASARALRRALGGNQRQVGIAAAAGLVAIQVMAPRLSEDHATAACLSVGLRNIPALRVSVPQTNIVLVDIAQTGRTAPEWVSLLHERGILVRPWGTSSLRCVTHRHIGLADVEQAVKVFDQLAIR